MSAFKTISENYRGLRASGSEIQAEFDRLRNSSPALGEVISRMEAAMNQQSSLMTQELMIRGMLVKTKEELSHNLLAIDEINIAIANNIGYLDPTITSYVEDMKLRATENLLKYHYLMAKAYEYRVVKQYTQKLDLQGLFSKMQELLEANVDGQLNADRYQSLKGLYDDQISGVISEILTDYAFDRRESKITFRLDSLQLIQFNKQGHLVINPMREGFIFNNTEDVRLIDLQVSRVEYDGAIDQATHQATRIGIQHSGRSNIVKDGKPHLFINNSIDNPQPHEYASVIDAISGEIVHEKPSPLDESLLRAILNSGGSSGADILLFSTPSVDGDLLISREDLNTGGDPIDFTDLLFSITYDYVSQSDNHTVITTSSNIGKPAIYLDKNDKNGRGSGYATFSRYFDKSYVETVLLEPTE